MVLFGVSSSYAANRASGTACNGDVATDFATPFSRMPRVHPPPKSGVLPFAPPRTHLYRSATSQIQAGGGGFGYAFSAERTPTKGFVLGWIVRTKVVEVDADGHEVKLVADRRHIWNVVHDIRRLDFWVPLTRRPAFYRYSLEFQRNDGHRLARYSQYVRVVPPTLKVALHASAPVYGAGENSVFQVANYGTEPISFGSGLTIKALVAGQWVPATGFSQSPVRRKAFGLEAGELGRCEHLPIPSDTPAGIYRAEKLISSLFSGADKRLTVKFQVGG